MLTPAQQRTLDFIRQYYVRQGFAPTLAEITLGLGVSSKGSMHKQVQALAEAGAIRLTPGRKRGIELTDEDEAQAFTIPLLGRIAAGHPIEAIPDQENLNIAEFLLGPGRFALLVQGDSMIDAGILDGDTVIIQRQDTANDGDIVVALIDDESATLKRFHRRVGNKLELAPENKSLRPLIFEAHQVRIQGVLVGQLRTY
jgi:repressor LexA